MVSLVGPEGVMVLAVSRLIRRTPFALPPGRAKGVTRREASDIDLLPATFGQFLPMKSRNRSSPSWISSEERA